ncbi:MmpS family transport accessory protein [Streptomyces sp. NPDC051219]|uniref:MmpS family transport accessory protein n=1 Tax=Streptomyces sp. NPDC051219 TaxID=3155283 RepID=UPI00344A5306
MAATDTPENAESPEPENSAPKAGSKGLDRSGIVIGVVLLIACGTLIGYGVLDTEDKPKPRAVPTAEVTYEVLGEGTADISYLGAGGSTRANIAKNAQLPWKKTVNVPIGKAPIVNVTLGEKGGQASCTLTIRSQQVQQSTASGEFGRTTCSAELTNTQAPVAPEALEGAQ